MNPLPRTNWRVVCPRLDAGWPPAFGPGAPVRCGDVSPFAASETGFRKSPS